MFEDYPNICRICLGNDELTSLFDVVIDKLELIELIAQYTSVQISKAEHHLPQSVCTTCVQHFQICYNIRKTSIDSERKIRNWLKNRKNNKAKIDSSNNSTVDKSISELENDPLETISPNANNATTPEVNDSKSTKCEQCSKSFRSQKNLVKHLQKIHNKSTTSTRQLRSRRTKRHESDKSSETQLEKEESPEPMDIPVVDETDNEKSRRQIYECKLCELQFTDKKKIYKHLIPETHAHLVPFDCKTCHVEITNEEELAQHVKFHKRVYSECFVCEFCGRGFKNASVLSYHKLTHTREKLLKCPMCDKEFVRKTSLQLHIKTHTNERPYKCDLCERTFTQSHVLRSHMRKHTGETPYQCDQCDRSYATIKSLSVHKYAHTEIEEIKKNESTTIPQYECKVCLKTFVAKYKWDRHQRAHKLIFQCCYCGKKFTNSKSLRQHEAIEAASKGSADQTYKCENCDKKFANEMRYIRHQRNFHNSSKYLEKKYPCKVCSMKFSKLSILKDHEVTHSLLQPFECTVCHRKFKRERTYAFHKRKFCKLKIEDESVVKIDVINKTAEFPEYVEYEVIVENLANPSFVEIIEAPSI